MNPMLKLRDKKLHVFQRPGSPSYYYRWYRNGRYITRTTKTDNLALAKSIAENAYDADHLKTNIQPDGKRQHLWAEVEQQILKSLSLDTTRRSRLQTYRVKLGILRQFFSDIPIEQIKTKTIEDYIHWRKTQYSANRPNYHHSSKSPSNKTILRDLDVLRRVLKYALREEWIEKLPEFPVLSVVPNAGGWFSLDEWTLLRTTAKKWIAEANTNDERTDREYLYDYMMFMVHVGCRVDECVCVQYQDCEISKKDPKFSLITIRGGKLAYLMKPTKMIGMYGATSSIERRKLSQPDHKPTDLIFPYSPRDLLVKLLKKTNLLHDERGQRRSAKSFRHTFIMFRLLRNVDVYKIAQNCRTSVKQIQSHYGSYINAELSFDELTKMPSKKQSVEDEP